MKSSTQIFWNSVTSGARQALTLGVLIVTTPMIIHGVGAEDFGLWSLTFSVVGFFGLFDLGFGISAIKYVAECKGINDCVRRNQILSTLAVVYAALGAIALLGTAVLARFYDGLFSITDAANGKWLSLLWILSLRVAILCLPLSLFRNILYAEQKIHLINLVQCVAAIALGVATWLVLSAGFGIVALAWLNLLIFLLEHIAYIVLAARLVPQLKLAWGLANYGLFKEVASFSLYAFSAQVAGLILLRTDTIIVKFFLPLSAVAVYAVALKMAENLFLLVKQLFNVFAPVAVEHWSRGDAESLRRVILQAAKFGFSIGLPVCITAWLFASDAIVLWIGPQFAQAGIILGILLAAMVGLMPQIAATAALTLTGHAKFTARAAFLSIALNIIVSVLLAPVLGLIGIALGTLVAALLVDVFLVLKKTCKTYDITVSEYAQQALRPNIIPAGCQLVVGFGIVAWLPPADLLTLALETLSTGMAYCAALWLFGLDRSEKDFLLSAIFRRPARLVLADDSDPKQLPVLGCKID